jgi:prepilin-type N-terminal cleavage/methylation domain-containing protein
MLLKLRQRMAREESGFTLVELLVVMLILGLLAAIAIPSFFNQRDKAKDADAKEAVRTAQTAIETYATDNDGLYSGATSDADGVAPYAGTDLQRIEQTLADVGANLKVTSTDDTYSVQVDSPDTGNSFRITRLNTGVTNLTCGGTAAVTAALGAGGNAGCPSSGNWG